jgi:hypothetical protein
MNNLTTGRDNSLSFVSNAYPSVGNVERLYIRELQAVVHLKVRRCSSCSCQPVGRRLAVRTGWKSKHNFTFGISLMAHQSDSNGVRYNDYSGDAENNSSQSKAFGSRQHWSPESRNHQPVTGALEGEAKLKYGKPKKIIVCGGDGFCGWPTSLFLSEIGHEVLILDNLSRRNIDNELEAGSLTPIYPISERIETWKQVSGYELRFERLDIANEYERLLNLLLREKPDAIIHFAEQRAAPYSMKGPSQKRYTVNNNVNATHNLLCAIVESNLDIHLVHLGTMGVYGYGTSGGEIPEGYIDIVLPGGQVSNILHPSYPVSLQVFSGLLYC